MSQVPQNLSNSAPSSAPAVSADPLRSLHKMSTTAGVSSQDYVAINLAAVWAIVLGLFSFLALLDNVLLIVPVIGIIFAIVALRQIATSAGTQTGRGIALLALALCLAFGGYTFAGQWIESAGDRSDRNSIDSLLQQLGRDVKDNKFDDAYSHFSENFRSHVKKERFTSVMQSMRTSPFYGNLTNITFNGHVRFEGTPNSEIRVAESVMLIYWDKSPDPMRSGIYFRRTNGKWFIEAIPDLFPAEKSAPASGPPTGA